MAGINHYTAFVASTKSELIASDAAVLYEAAGQNLSAAAVWLQIFDRATAPAPASVPVYSYLVQPNETFAIAPPPPPGDNGRRMQNGIAVGFSSTQATFTETADVGGTLFVAWREATNSPVP